MFEAALSRSDLNGAQAANAVEENATQRFIDRLGTIDWPAGFEDQVNALRDSLRKLIEFDRRQVDVATAAQIVPAPEEGGPADAIDDAMTSLHKGLSQAAHAVSDPGTKC